MAAPSIPNLATLRGRTGLRGRGRGAGRGGPRSVTTDTSMTGEDTTNATANAKDRAIQQTDGDAASSRMSAVTLGYLTDDYATHFAPNPSPRRYPLINRGTYVRTLAIDRLVRAFLDEGEEDDSCRKQIISLGAGSDTRFFRLAGEGYADGGRLVYHELDFASNTRPKIERILGTPQLRSTLPEGGREGEGGVRVSEGRESLHSSTLNMHALDLRSLASPSPPPDDDSGAAKTLPNLDPALSTLLLSECCLTYIPAASSYAILRHILTTLLRPRTPAALVLYEPIGPDDAFGRTMTANLAARGIDMPSVRALPTLAAHWGRLRGVGLGAGVGGRTVADIYAGRRPSGSIAGRGGGADEKGPGGGGDQNSGQGTTDEPSIEEWVSDEERARVERLEWLDEVEEWEMLAGHYCVVWGWRDGVDDRDGGGRRRDVFSRAWVGMPGGQPDEGGR